MKLLEFFGTIRENDSNGHGTFVGARLTRDSERAIMQWMRDNGLRKKEPRARFHITVVGDKEQEFDWNPQTYDPPIEIDPNSYRLAKFDDGAVVLSFSVPTLERRHQEAVDRYGIDWKYPTYQPHLTLSYDPTELNDIDRLLKPTFPLYVANEYAQPWGFKESDSRSERRRKPRLAESILMERNVMNAPKAKKYAQSMANAMFGDAPGAVQLPDGKNAIAQKWAETALFKYFINEAPAAQILSFEPEEGVLPAPGAPNYGELSGRGKVHHPDVMSFGIMKNKQLDRKITEPEWVPDALARGEEIFSFNTRVANDMLGEVQEVKDWFRHIGNENPDRINAGRLGRMTWLQAAQAAQEWHDSLRGPVNDEGEHEGDRELYMEVDNGAAWWKLTGPSCINREGDLMGHCVADYIEDVYSGRTVILSLRDAKNQPHVTVELNDGFNDEHVISQVKGKENKPPVEKYWPYVIELIKKLATEERVVLEDEAKNDLSKMNVEEIGPMLIRTSEEMDDARVSLSMEYHIPGRKHVWFKHDHDEMPLWNALDILVNNEILASDIDEGPDTPAIHWVKWQLLRNGEWTAEARSSVENPDYGKGIWDTLDDTLVGKQDNADAPAYLDDVPVDISIYMPNMDYEILSGNPEEYYYDIDQYIASRESST